ncbi:MAG: hemolysin family protein [Hyphomicrobiaceae bacterium]
MANTNDVSSTTAAENGQQPAAEPARSNGGPGWFSTLRSRLGLGPQQTLRETLEEAVRAEPAGDATFSSAERDMLLRLLRFGGLSVEDVMVPRAEIIAIDEAASVGELMNLFDDAGVSRIPVYRDTLDDPRGMVHVKDVLRYLTRATPSGEGAAAANDAATTGDLDRSIVSAGLLRPVLNVPPSMPAVNLLIRMQAARNHIALVIDEYGGTDGLVTIEDLVEQVVGDIEDEYDVEEAANIVDDPRLGLVAQARTPIAELEAHLGLTLLDEEDRAEIDTVGGMVVALLGRVPVKGELVKHQSGIELEVLDADPRRIKRVRIHRDPAAGRRDPNAPTTEAAALPPAGTPPAEHGSDSALEPPRRSAGRA